MVNLIKKLTILPRWIIIVIDFLIISVSAITAYLLRFNFDIPEIYLISMPIGIASYVFANGSAIFITRSYSGIVRYTSLQDLIRLFYSSTLGLVIICLLNLITNQLMGYNLIPYSVVIITYFVSFLLLFYYRLLVKTIFSYYAAPARKKNRILIFGAGQAGIITNQIISSDTSSYLQVVGFIEDDDHKIGKTLDGKKIYGAEKLRKVITSLKIDELVIAILNLPLQRKNEIVDLCLQLGIKVRQVPPAKNWVKGELSLKQIKDINIEDLLGRETIRLRNSEVFEQVSGKVVLITGAAGSIGSEIVRQITQLSPLSMVLVDQAESALFELEMELRNLKLEIPIEYYIADITDKIRLSRIFSETQPQLVFHAAAYKHVPLMERNVFEAIKCNVLGTKNLADASVENGVEKFVMISTDKAVNPTSIMGSSKRIAEIYVQALNNHLKNAGLLRTTFVTTRFGNVLGSNGSVIPLFKKQINKGGPITVTHPEVTRYFMTISEACELVLEAGTMAKGGEIFIFDMGESVKIVDLAKKMIKLSGLELNKDIEIVFTGLREGEKLYEELLASKENTLPTHHEKILIAEVREYDYDKVTVWINSLIDNATSTKSNEFEVIELLKQLIPEYCPKNQTVQIN